MSRLVTNVADSSRTSPTRHERRPALIALAHGSRDPRSARTIAALVDDVRARQPGLRAEAAFLDLSEPSFDAVVDRLVAEGHEEIVVVPLLLTRAFHARVDVPSALAAAEARHPGAWLRLAPVLGLGAWLLPVLDARLGAALRSQPIDAVVVASAGSSDSSANAAVAELAASWAAQRGLPFRVAFASTASPSAGEAVRELHAAGHRRVALASLFLAPGLLPDRAAELAREAGALAVSEPLGAHAEVARAVLARYAVGAAELVPA